MSVTANLALTAAGQALRAKIEEGDGSLPLAITRIATASGASADPLALDALVDEKQEFMITGRQTDGPRTTITAALTNAGDAGAGIPPLAQGYNLSQIGFYALDPDVGEILYRISQFDPPSYVPAASERGWTYNASFNFVTGNASTVNITVDPSGGVTQDDLAALESAIEAERQRAQAAEGATSDALAAHVSNADIHVTADQKAAWDGGLSTISQLLESVASMLSRIEVLEFQISNTGGTMAEFAASQLTIISSQGALSGGKIVI